MTIDSEYCSVRGGGGRVNFLIIVLDCVRAIDFPGSAESPPRMPFVETLRRGAWEFDRAASVAHWTVPAHASIFTGLYPWQHGVHAKGRWALPPEVPRLAQMLGSAGYATFSVSANDLISPALGLTGGYDRWAWGVSLFNRVSQRTRPPWGSEAEPGPSRSGEGLLRKRFKNTSHRAAETLARRPGVWDLGTRFVNRLRPDLSGLPPRLAPWLEPTLDRWLREVPPERPVFCFANLMDAHEPYLADPLWEPTSSDWKQYARTRQDALGWIKGEWVPTPAEFDRLRALYRRTITEMDQRIERIVGAFQRSGRWEETVLVLTSDHGQAFGERGNLFHIASIDESELRIPLLLRLPNEVQGHGRARGWASLVDIAPTFLRAADLGRFADRLPGRDLMSLLENERGEPIFALGDGLVHGPEASRAPLARRIELDRILVGAYLGERKLIFDPHRSTVEEHDLEADRYQERTVEAAALRERDPMFRNVAGIVHDLGAPAAAAMDREVEERLRNWGYL